METFSQNKEDATYAPLLPEKGRMMEIGAFDPVMLSNSRALILKGWDAVLVEPNPNALKNIVDFYRTIEPNPQVTIVNALVTAEETPKIVPFQLCWDAVSTTEKHHFDLWKNTVKFYETHCITTPISELFSAFPGPYDFISVDVEGCSFDLSRYVLAVVKPTVVCVEHQGYDRDAIISYAHDNGYEMIIQTSENIIIKLVQN